MLSLLFIETEHPTSRGLSLVCENLRESEMHGQHSYERALPGDLMQLS